MKLKQEFIQLPFIFDVTQLKNEVDKFNQNEWVAHPQRYHGNWSIPLVSVRGELNDRFDGQMRATRFLEQSPHIQQTIAFFEEVIGRSRLMRLDGGSHIPRHADINYHWHNRVRIHIPIITNSKVTFYCGDKEQVMQEGECWLLDTWQEHHVENLSDQTRVHLVIDTAGSSKFWNLVDQCINNDAGQFTNKMKQVSFSGDEGKEILMENYNVPLVMSPGEVDGLCVDLLKDAIANRGNNPKSLELFESIINNFRLTWRQIWSIHGELPTGWPIYHDLIKNLPPKLEQPVFLASNKQLAYRSFLARVVTAALNPESYPQ